MDPAGVKQYDDPSAFIPCNPDPAAHVEEATRVKSVPLVAAVTALAPFAFKIPVRLDTTSPDDDATPYTSSGVTGVVVPMPTLPKK